MQGASERVRPIFITCNEPSGTIKEPLPLSLLVLKVKLKTWVIKKRKENYEDEEKSCIWNIIIYMYDNSNHGGYFNSGIVIEPISSLQEQLEEMTEEMKMS